MAAQIDTVRNRLAPDEEESEERPDVMDELDELYSEIVTSEEGSYQPPMLIDQLEYLYYMTISADQRPGDDAYTRFDTLSKQLDDLLSEWDQLKESMDLPEM
jgi:hypothetical protein